jgi:hypothetical protein
MSGQDVAWVILVLGAIWWIGRRAGEAIDRYERHKDQLEAARRRDE